MHDILLPSEFGQVARKKVTDMLPDGKNGYAYLVVACDMEKGDPEDQAASTMRALSNALTGHSAPEGQPLVGHNRAGREGRGLVIAVNITAGGETAHERREIVRQALQSCGLEIRHRTTIGNGSRALNLGAEPTIPVVGYTMADPEKLKFR